MLLPYLRVRVLSLTVLLCAPQAQEAEGQSKGNGAFTQTFKKPPGFSVKEVPTAASHLADQARDTYLLKWTTDSSIIEKHRWGGGKSGKFLFTFPSLRAELLRLKRRYGPGAAIHLRALDDWSVARIKSTAQQGETPSHLNPLLLLLLSSSPRSSLCLLLSSWLLLLFFSLLLPFLRPPLVPPPHRPPLVPPPSSSSSSPTLSTSPTLTLALCRSLSHPHSRPRSRSRPRRRSRTRPCTRSHSHSLCRSPSPSLSPSPWRTGSPTPHPPPPPPGSHLRSASAHDTTTTGPRAGLSKNRALQDAEQGGLAVAGAPGTSSFVAGFHAASPRARGHARRAERSRAHHIGWYDELQSRPRARFLPVIRHDIEPKMDITVYCVGAACQHRISCT